MKRPAMTAALLLGALALVPLVSGCAPRASQDQAAATTQDQPQARINCIAVLPAATPVDHDGDIGYKEAQTLEQGAEAMDHLLAEYFGGADSVRFLTSQQVAALTGLDTAHPAEVARAAALKAGCNAALETTVTRFRQRVGSTLAAETPAAAGFRYRLIEANSGRVLCWGKYDEVQRSVTENLFDLHKAASRGFDWVTAEALLGEGIEDRFKDCAYLADPR